MNTIDAADAHAYAMFCAGWKAAFTMLQEAEDIWFEPGTPDPADFYRAVPDPNQRECALRHVIGIFAHETQALQARVRALMNEADLVAQQGVALRRLMEQRLTMLASIPARREGS